MSNLEQQYDPNVDKDFVGGFNQKWREIFGCSMTLVQTSLDLDKFRSKLNNARVKGGEVSRAIEGIRNLGLSQYRDREKDLINDFNRVLKQELGDCVAPAQTFDDIEQFGANVQAIDTIASEVIAAVKEISALESSK